MTGSVLQGHVCECVLMTICESCAVCSQTDGAAAHSGAGAAAAQQTVVSALVNYCDVCVCACVCVSERERERVSE